MTGPDSCVAWALRCRGVEVICAIAALPEPGARQGDRCRSRYSGQRR